MLAAASLAFAISSIALVVLRASPMRSFALDLPNERSLHTVPVPRTGGIAVVLGVAATMATFGEKEHLPFVVILALAAVSLCDDIFDVPTLARLAAHFCGAAAILVLFGLYDNPFLFAVLLLGLVWATNLYNFMDGIDGLAGGMAVIGFAALAFQAQASAVAWLALLCASTAAAALAFLVFNFPPARIFLGDTGSIPLGFLAGAAGAAGWQAGAWDAWFAILVFAPFGFDATLTLAKRLLRGEKVWQAHREHYYQRLVRMGVSRRGVLLGEYAAMVACAAAAIATQDASQDIRHSALVACLAAFALLAVWIDRRWARFVQGQAR